jgi:hypothetical protein
MHHFHPPNVFRVLSIVFITFETQIVHASDHFIAKRLNDQSAYYGRDRA